MEKAILEEMGLTGSESLVYLALLELGKSSSGKIVDKSGVSSSKVYEILDKLIKKGLASYIIERGVKYFEASEPERIFDLLEQREKQLKEQRKKIDKLIPLLHQRQLLSKYKSEATVYKGLKGLHAAFYGVLEKLKKGDEFLAMNIPKRSKQVNRFFVKFSRDLKFKSANSRLIFNENAKGEDQTTHSYYKNIKYLPETTPAAINILGERTIIFPNEAGEDFILIVIDNKDIAESFKVQFEKLWEQDFKVKKGFNGVKEAFNSMLDELQPSEEYYVLGASWAGKIHKIDDFYLDFHKRREEKGVRAKLLFISGAQKIINNIKKNYGKLAQIKFLPKGRYEGIQFNLYKNKILMFVWREKEPIVFSIEDKKMFETFKAYFDSNWNSRIVTHNSQEGIEVAYDEFYDKLNSKDEFLLFAAKPKEKRASQFNLEWVKKVAKKVKVRIIYYGFTKENIQRAIEYKSNGIAVKIYDTKETLPISTLISGNKIINTIWEENPYLFQVENKVMAQSYKQNFEIIWKQAKEI